MPNRMNPIAKYLFALSAMIVAWTAYAKFAVPILEGPPAVVRRQQVDAYYPDVAEILDKSHLPTIVPADAWELGKCKTLLTPQGTVYFEHFEPVDDKGTYLFMPFTIVMNDPVNRIRKAPLEEEVKTKPAPIVLRALQGARLKFSKPLTARSSKGEIELESAQLEGQVTLFRPVNPGTDESELRAVMENVQVSRSQIFTLSDVFFSFGPHHGSGRNLSIQLTHEPGEDSPTKSFSNINGVEQMELAYVSELVLQPADVNAFNPDNREQGPASAMDQPLSLSNQKTPLRLSCDGPFVFRMAEKKAWFRDNVVVTQLNDFRDNLQCDSLQIELEKKEASGTTSVKKLIAIGTPDKPATIEANSQQTQIMGEELNFDVESSSVKATGSTPITVRGPKFGFLAPGCEYQLAKDGRLGLLSANGPGILKGVSEDQKAFEVKWGRKLTTRDFDAERVQIEVDNDASVKFDNQSQITADRLKFLVWQLPDPQSTTKKQKWKYFPSQLETVGDVRIFNDQVDGSANELVANWPKPTAQQLGTVTHSVSYRPRPTRPRLTRPRPTRPAQQQDDFRPLPSAVPAIKFAGDKVIANLTGGMKKMQVRDLYVDGSLSLESTAKDRRPIAITGHSMKLVPQSKKLYRVTVDGNQGRPATFKTDGFNLVGNNLQLDQSANTIWVQGAGKLNIVPPRDTRFVPADAEVPKLDNAEVAWNGGMVFDGSKIYFENKVELTANRPPNSEGHRSTVKTDGEALTIELTESIRFEELESGERNVSGDNQPEIKRMVFVNRVAENNRAFKLASVNNTPPMIAFQNATFDAKGNVVDLQKLLVPTATVDAQSGEIVTSGPGQALVYQYSNGSNRLSGLTSTSASNGSSQRRLTCIHARFDGQLTANSNKGTMRIDRNTRSAWGNVDRFDQVLDPDRPDQLPIGAAVLKSDLLRFAQWTPRNGEPRQEMQAVGNASIKSELFEAVADQMRYNDATDLLVIEGKPPANAKLSYRRNASAQPRTLRLQKIKYRLSDQWTDMSDVRGGEVNLSPEK